MAQAQTKAAEHELTQDIETLRSDLDGLRKDFGQLMSTLKGTASNRAEAELDAMRKRLNKLADDVTTTGRQQLRSVESQIEERPLVSLAIAFAIGLVLGRLLDRR
jgi:ElaB/YqjD/DUF883 family membrane-anchored ribosome-binding protein